MFGRHIGVARLSAKVSPGEMKRLDHSPNIAILENCAWALSSFSNGDIYHGPAQIVSPNHLIREQDSKRGIDPAHEAIAEVRFLPRLYGVDIRGPEKVNVREPGRE